MHTGKSYKLFEFLDWTRKDIYVLIVLGVVPAVYSIPEMQTPLEAELAKFLPHAELMQILATGSKATQILGLQSKAIKGLFASQVIVVTQFVEMQTSIRDFLLFCFPSVCSGNSTASMKASRG